MRSFWSLKRMALTEAPCRKSCGNPISMALTALSRAMASAGKGNCRQPKLSSIWLALRAPITGITTWFFCRTQLMATCAGEQISLPRKGWSVWYWWWGLTWKSVVHKFTDWFNRNPQQIGCFSLYPSIKKQKRTFALHSFHKIRLLQANVVTKYFPADSENATSLPALY